MPKLKMTETLNVNYDKEKYAVKYTSSNAKTVSVSKDGKVKGIKMGTAKITIRLYQKGNTKTAVSSKFVNVTVKPTLYLKHLTGKKFVISGGKKYKKKKGVQFKIVGVDKPFYLFYKAGNKKYSIYTGKKWKKKTKSIPKGNQTWVPLSGKKYSFYISTDKKGKEKSKSSSNVIRWKI